MPGDRLVNIAARSLAGLKDISLGDALAELARRGFSPPVSVKREKPFPCFAVPEHAESISLEQTPPGGSFGLW